MPVLPVAVPGADDSPGANACSFTNAPAITVSVELPETLAGCVTSEAVTDTLPASLFVIVNVFVPPTSAALAGRIAFASEA